MAIRAYPLLFPVKSNEVKPTWERYYPFSWDGLHVDSTLWDDSRHGLWVMDNKGTLVWVDICKHEAILKAFHSVPTLAVFPPGVLPICMAYVGPVGCGSVRVWDRVTQFETAMVKDEDVERKRLDMPHFSMCVESSSGNLFIAGGDSFILQYEPETRRFTKISITGNDILSGSIRWSRIVTNGNPGCFMLVSSDTYCYRWTAGTSVATFSPVTFGDVRIPIAVKHGKIFQLADNLRLYSMDIKADDLDVESDLTVDGYNRVYPTLVSSSSTRGIYMVTATTLTFIMPKRIRDRQERWQCTGLPMGWATFILPRGASNHFYPFPVHGHCNGTDIMFYSTHDRTTIDCLDLPPIPADR